MWFCYHSDFSGFAFFNNEIEALRYAVDNSMSCKEIKNGNSKIDF